MQIRTGAKSPADAFVAGSPPHVDDLVPTPPERPVGIHADGLHELEPLFRRLDAEASDAIRWYYGHRRRFAQFARAVRVLAIVAFAAGGLVPLLIPAFPIGIESGYASLIIGAALLAVDRFGGYSTTWIRYTQAAQQLTADLRRFRIDWEALKAEAVWSESPAALSVRAFELLRTFGERIGSVVEKETQTWASEFRMALPTVAVAPQETVSEPSTAPPPPILEAVRAPVVSVVPKEKPARYFLRIPETGLRVYRTMRPDQEPDFISRVLPNLLIASLDAAEVEALRRAKVDIIPSRRYAPVFNPAVYQPLRDDERHGDMTAVLAHIRAPQAWKTSRGKDVHVAVIDTGVANAIAELPAWKRSPYSWPIAGQPWQDDDGHGSMCAAIAVGTSADGGSYDGVAPDAQLIACRSTLDSTELVEIYEHLILLVREKKIGRLVISNSYGFYQAFAPGADPDDPFPAVIRQAVHEGIVVVFAAGNNHYVVGQHDPLACEPNSIWDVNSLDSVLSVGTVNQDHRMSDPPQVSGGYSHRDSSRGPGELASRTRKPDCVAPTYGRVVWGAGYRTMEWWGTSGAAPQVAGLAALLLSANPAMTPLEVYDRIRRSCTPIGLAATCAGAGLINCEKAMDGS